MDTFDTPADDEQIDEIAMAIGYGDRRIVFFVTRDGIAEFFDRDFEERTILATEGVIAKYGEDGMLVVEPNQAALHLCERLQEFHVLVELDPPALEAVRAMFSYVGTELLPGYEEKKDQVLAHMNRLFWTEVNPFLQEPVEDKRGS